MSRIEVHAVAQLWGPPVGDDGKPDWTRPAVLLADVGTVYPSLEAAEQAGARAKEVIVP